MSRADYAHWNEDQDYMWWQEEGRHVEEPPDQDDYDNFVYDRNDDRAEEQWEKAYEIGQAHAKAGTPANLTLDGLVQSRGDLWLVDAYIEGRWEHGDPEFEAGAFHEAVSKQFER